MVVPIITASITVMFVLAIGAWLATVGTWYRELRKPRWNPPDRVFGPPAWTVILALAAWAGVLAWTNSPNDSSGRSSILVLFGINIVLHILWSPLFFTLKRPDLALIEVPFLWLSIAALMFGAARYSTWRFGFSYPICFG
jgi:tryptophan-rich sensory protein